MTINTAKLTLARIYNDSLAFEGLTADYMRAIMERGPSLHPVPRLWGCIVRETLAFLRSRHTQQAAPPR